MSRWRRTLQRTYDRVQRDGMLDEVPKRCPWCGALVGKDGGYLCGQAGPHDSYPSMRLALRWLGR